MQELAQQKQFGAQGYMQGVGAQMGAYGQMRGTDIQEQQGQEALQNQQNQQYVDLAKANAANSQKGVGGIIGGIGSAIGAISDIRAKENIAPVEGGYDNRGTMGPYEHGIGNSMNYGPLYQQPGTEVPYMDWTQKDPGAAQGAPAGGGGRNALQQWGDSQVSTMSDERTKEGIHPLDQVKPYTFDYKDETAHRMASEAAQNTYAKVFMDAKQPREGVMAQDLQKDPRTPDGLQIEGKRALAFMMGNQAELNERLNRLEGNHGR
jgi:Chaperone of endosialidase